MLRAISRGIAVVRAYGKELRHNEAGSVVTLLVAVPVLAGTVALGVETGQFYRVKRQMQGAADAAAIAGSYDRLNGAATGTIVTDGRYEAQRNGFTNGASGVTVTINSPPTSGPNIGTTGAVEAIITKTQAFSLGGVLLNWMGLSNNGFTMRARSVAAQGSITTTTTGTTTTSSTTQEGCIVALTTANEQGISISSFNNFSSDCSIMSNGGATTNDVNASIYIGSFNNAILHSSANDARVWTRGSFYKTSYNSFTADGTLTGQTATITDPYSSLTIPSSLTCTYTNYVEPSGSSLTLSPGTYCGGLSVTNKSNIYFTPGTYFIANGDLIIRSDNNVSCPNCTSSSGLTFILTQTTGNNSDIGGVVITSENNISLNAGSSNTYPGVLFYQDRRVTPGTMTSTSKIFTLSSLNNATLAGAVYFPNNRIDISSINNVKGDSTSGCTVWIGRYIKLSSYNNAWRGGCANYGTTPPGVTTTTTTTSATNTTTNLAKVVE